MKIISKYKDYYDYLSGIIGIDTKVVLDRRIGYVIKERELHTNERGDFNHIRLDICGKSHLGLYDWRGRFHWGDSVLKCGKYLKQWNCVQYKSGHSNYSSIKLGVKETHLNDKENCPILLVNHGDSCEYFPMLKYLGMPSFYPAEKIYTDIYSWISARNEPKIIDNRRDVDKLESAGFDKKISFRHRK